ncbi:MAG: NUDIX hydrolase [Candidatus Marinimicrobia bacterium]|nr:NUDIX hydrolase [Candidatus Neomarinimicrobiota bacterium]
MKEFVEKTKSSRNIFKGKLLDVYVDEVLLPSGRTAVREYIKHPGAAVVIPYVGNGELIFVRQYRYPVREVTVELPAGKIDTGEDSIATVERELIEETGYRANRFVELLCFYPSVGYTNEILCVYWAQELSYIGERPDPDENIEVMKMSISEAVERIFAGDIKDSKTIIGVLIADRLLGDENLKRRFGIKL